MQRGMSHYSPARKKHLALEEQALTSYGLPKRSQGFWDYQTLIWPGLRVTFTRSEALSPTYVTWTATDESGELWLMLNAEE